VYVPGSIVYHKEGVSFKKAFGKKGVMKIVARNMHLFIWKNIRYAPYLMQYIIFMPLWLLFYVLRGRFYFISGFFAAFKSLPDAMARRAAEKANKYYFSDRYIINDLCNAKERA
jgi:GT2 family glycosyltransferase